MKIPVHVAAFFFISALAQSYACRALAIGDPQREDRDSGADAYVDGTTGFSLTPPKDWQVARERTVEGRGLTVLRMIGSAGPNQWQQILVRQAAISTRQPVDQTLRQVADALELEFSNVAVQSQQTQQIAGVAGGLISATYMREGGRKLRIEAFVETGPRSMLWLVYDGPADRAAGGETVFNELLGSLVLRKPSLSEDELATALEAGKEWLSSRGAKDIERMRNIDETLRIEVDGKPVGFLTLEAVRSEHEGKAGNELRERGWTFDPRGSVQRVQRNLFISDDMHRERWQTSTTVLVPPSGDRPAYLEVAMEEALRSDDLLLSNQSYQLNQPAISNPALKLPKTYMPRAIVRLLPMLAGDVDKPRRMAFTVFDHRIALSHQRTGGRRRRAAQRLCKQRRHRSIRAVRQGQDVGMETKRRRETIWRSRGQGAGANGRNGAGLSGDRAALRSTGQAAAAQ